MVKNHFRAGFSGRLGTLRSSIAMTGSFREDRLSSNVADDARGVASGRGLRLSSVFGSEIAHREVTGPLDQSRNVQGESLAIR